MKRPRDELARALLEIGLTPKDLTHVALRAYVHTSTGYPPEEHTTTDQLAQEVLYLHEVKLLRGLPGRFSRTTGIPTK